MTTTDDTRRLALLVPTGVALALARLAKHQGGTQQEVVASLIAAADDAILAGMSPDTDEWNTYFSIRVVRL